MILVYQILHGLLNVDASFFFSQTTYTPTRITISKYIRRVLTSLQLARAYTFLNRVINDWNSLPDYIVTADSLRIS